MSGIIVFIRSVGTAHTGYPVRISAIAEPIPPASAPVLITKDGKEKEIG